MKYPLEMSHSSRDKYVSDVERLAATFMAPRNARGSASNKRPKTFRDVRLNEVRHNEFLDYFCTRSKKGQDDGDENSPKNHALLEWPIEIYNLQMDAHADWYVKTIVEYVEYVR